MSILLLVDDDDSARRTLQRVLAAEGHVVEAAADGRDALQRLDGLCPDLVLSDVVMPRMSGFALLRELRERPERTTLPVILLTALEEDCDRVEAFRLGADDYITKPVDIDELLVRVRNLLVRRRLDGGPALTGRLNEMGVSSLLGIFENDRKDGVLHLWRGAERADLFLRAGRIVCARFVGRTDSVGAECVYELVGWGEGSFAFVSGPVGCADEVSTSTLSLLLEGMRRLDEQRASSR